MENRILGNRYELVERIGGGGMAVVYKAKCRLLNRFVAVKILRDEFIDDEEFVKRFRIEAQAAASLSHPNIVSIFDVGHEDKTHYIVMEYVDGITLKEYINKKGALPWKEAAKIAIQICSAIEQAHKNHIIHRDIKPHNILLTKEGIAKVTDFGIARAVSSSTITMVGSTIGSVHYFSPEQARGGFTDEKSDLYSLGITFYEMVTGKVPFDGESPVAVALKHIQNKADCPFDINPDIPRPINDIIMKAIKKDQNFRYQNASELLADLQRALRDPNTAIENISNCSEEFPTRKMFTFGDTKNERYDDMLDADSLPEKKRIGRTGVWLGIITGLIIVAIFSYIGYRIVIPMIMPEEIKDFVAGDYIGKDFLIVQGELAKNNIQAAQDKVIFSDTIEKGTIISQDIAPGKPMNNGSTIKFEVSGGLEFVTVPDVSLKESRIAEQDLKVVKLKTQISNEYHDSIGTGLVIRTEPAAAEQIRPDTVVTVVVSLGPQLYQIKVPNLVGLTRTQAETLINENRLKIGNIMPSDVISDVAGIVTQYPPADAFVDEGTPVDLTFDVEAPDSTQNTSNEKTVSWKITLENPDRYGDEVLVYVEATPSDTNTASIIKNEKVKKDSFPVAVDIPLTQGGKTHVIVKLDGVVVQDRNY